MDEALNDMEDVLRRARHVDARDRASICRPVVDLVSFSADLQKHTAPPAGRRGTHLTDRWCTSPLSLGLFIGSVAFGRAGQARDEPPVSCPENDRRNRRSNVRQQSVIFVRLLPRRACECRTRCRSAPHLVPPQMEKCGSAILQRITSASAVCETCVGTTLPCGFAPFSAND